MSSSTLRPARVHLVDVIVDAFQALRSRPLRAILSALGISIGVATMVTVVGLSTSSRAELDRRLEALGTNMLTVAPGRTVYGEPATLPLFAPRMIARIGPVTDVTEIGEVRGAVYRNSSVPSGQTGSLAIRAVRPALKDVLGLRLRRGRWLDTFPPNAPLVVLGSTAASSLALDRAGDRVWLGGEWFGVAAILDPSPLSPDLDRSVLVPWASAERWLGFRARIDRIYTRCADDQVEQVRTVLAATANPAAATDVVVSRPSDALAAQRAGNATMNGLLIGLAVVALVVGGIGVANTMIIGVMERRSEIGLRRALGATKGTVHVHVLSESIVLAAAGGAAGVVAGYGCTALYATSQAWPVVVPPWVGSAGLAATIPIGALAGLLPALSAARLDPVAALANP